MRIGRCLEPKRKDDVIVDMRHRLDERFGFERIVGQSQAMLRLFEHAHRAAAVDSTVLVTGKRAPARKRSQKPFIRIAGAKADRLSPRTSPRSQNKRWIVSCSAT